MVFHVKRENLVCKIANFQWEYYRASFIGTTWPEVKLADQKQTLFVNRGSLDILTLLPRNRLC